jgi:HEAT repeat protein
VALGHQAVPRLKAAASHDDRNVRWQAIVALGRIGSPAADSATDLLANALRNDSDPDVRSGAAEALGRLRLRSEPVLAALRHGITDAHGKVRADAHWALAQLQAHPQALPALADLLAHKDWLIAESASRHLASFGADALPVLLATLEQGPGRLGAVNAMAQMEPDVLKPAGEPLLLGLDDPDPAVASACARALARLDAAVLPRLHAYLAATPRNPAGALRALGHCESAGGGSLPHVLPFLDSETAAVRLAAIECLSALGSEARSAAPALTKLLSHEDADLRAGAAAALGHCDAIDAQSASELRRLADSDPAHHVRAAAAQSLTSYVDLPKSRP